MAPTISRRALNRATLARQMLLRREALTPVAAVERLVGVQAQLARPPFVGLWSRLERFQRDDLGRAITQKDVVRGTMMRGTLHLVSRKDFVAFRPALTDLLSQGSAKILGDRAKGIDVAKLVAAAWAYFDEAPRTFAELREHLHGKFPTLDARAMGYIVRMHLPLVQTPEAGASWSYPGTADFAVAESWIGKPLKARDTPNALALRYFTAFGPASVQDLQTWSGLSAMGPVVDALRPKLRTFQDERRRELFDIPRPSLPSEDTEAPVRFLPEFDSLLLAYGDRMRVMDDKYRPAIFTKNLLVPATFTVDGFIVGTWRAERKAKAATLFLKAFASLAKPARKALEDEGARLIGFLEPDAPKTAVVFSTH